jgi:hypothetical protein
LAVCAALSSGCAALPFVPSLLGGLGGGNPPSVQIGTGIELSNANFCTVRANAVGESRGLKLLAFFTVIPTSYVKAYGNLQDNAQLDTERAQVLANVVHENTAQNFLLFALTRVTVRADVVEFLEPGAPCPRALQPIQSSRSRAGTALAPPVP